METNRLYKLAEKNNIKVCSFHLPVTQAVALQSEDGYFIGIDTDILTSECKERVCLAHEIGHCTTSSFYSASTPMPVREKCEKKAEKWAITNLIPITKLKTAIKNGTTSINELAQHFSVTENFMEKAIKFYSES